jgi:galactokinase/mevalonate kinase-like predicted kinase
MSTPFYEIDNMFLKDISDDTFLLYGEEEREEILDDLRSKAVTRFKACKKNLSDINLELKQFNDTLTNEEKLIIATIMRKHWLSDKIYNLELLKQRMSNKDWRLTSQAEHLLRLTVLNQELEKEISRMIVDYALYAYSVDK